MATSLTLQNDASSPQGYVKVNGTTSATFTTSGITGNLVGNVTGNVTGSLTQGGSLTLGTAQTAPFTAPNTYADFTGIPSWAKRITVMFNGVSTSGTSNLQIQIGSGGITSSGYVSQCGFSTSFTSFTTGFGIATGITSVNTINGNSIINIVGSNIYTQNSVFGSPANVVYIAGGSVTLSGTLDRIRITTVNGTDTFDAGTINIMFEG